MEDKTNHAKESNKINALAQSKSKSKDVVKPLLLPVEGLHIEIPHYEYKVELEEIDNVEGSPPSVQISPVPDVVRNDCSYVEEEH